jgi:hypothetical protein
MSVGEARRAIWPGIIRLDVAGCGWATVAVGSQLGSQLGFPREPAGMRSPGGGAARLHEMRAAEPSSRGSGTARRHSSCHCSALTSRTLTSFGLTGVGAHVILPMVERAGAHVLGERPQPASGAPPAALDCTVASAAPGRPCALSGHRTRIDHAQAMRLLTWGSSRSLRL